MLIYDIIRKLLDSLTERDLDLLVLILKSKFFKLMHTCMYMLFIPSSFLLSLQLVVWRSGGMIAWLSKYNVFSNNNDYSFIVGYYY